MSFGDGIRSGNGVGRCGCVALSSVPGVTLEMAMEDRWMEKNVLVCL